MNTSVECVRYIAESTASGDCETSADNNPSGEWFG